MEMQPPDKSSPAFRQKYLGEKGLIALIILLSAFIPLSTDLYLPSLPGMARYFNSPAYLVNLTLILFFLFFSAGALLWGPLSDKYGRKPVLLIGLSVYCAASIACAVSWGIYPLIIFRVLQAIGGSSAFGVATAMIKDVYDIRRRETILAMVQSMVLISPAVAPVFGAVLLKFMSWRGAFWALTLIGMLALSGSIALQETIEKRHTGSMLQVLGRLYTVGRNPNFSSLLGLFSLPALSSMAFIASSSYIFINSFGLTPQSYSFYFSINAIGLISGPMLYLRVSRKFRRRSIIITCFTVVSTSGLLIFFFGGLQPWILSMVVLPATICGSCLRTPGVNLMLEQQKEDTGSASALINCFGILMGSIGMTVISLDWGSIILALGIMNLIIGMVCGALWLNISRKSYVVSVPERYIA
ncbi:MAG TPA: Bcr/CflA family efflux MFS transporter [Desulfobacteraceae bacterium]|nr:Bcr/CflA family efflux MFS transporter [Desulfobacteraceae bacterium]HPQ28652.1 Bcr/CflA family efflux MFS transporter [Desulfobacteraceae bacterium]